MIVRSAAHPAHRYKYALLHEHQRLAMPSPFHILRMNMDVVLPVQALSLRAEYAGLHAVCRIKIAVQQRLNGRDIAHDLLCPSIDQMRHLHLAKRIRSINPCSERLKNRPVAASADRDFSLSSLRHLRQRLLEFLFCTLAQNYKTRSGLLRAHVGIHQHFMQCTVAQKRMFAHAADLQRLLQRQTLPLIKPKRILVNQSVKEGLSGAVPARLVQDPEDAVPALVSHHARQLGSGNLSLAQNLLQARSEFLQRMNHSLSTHVCIPPKTSITNIISQKSNQINLYSEHAICAPSK